MVLGIAGECGKLLESLGDAGVWDLGWEQVLGEGKAYLGGKGLEVIRGFWGNSKVKFPKEMTGGSIFKRAKKAICRGGSSRDEQENPTRHRGRTTCADKQNMPPRTRIHIEVNENNIPESILLGTYLGVVAGDPILAPIAFPNWRNKGMESFKKKMLAKVEAEYWDSRPIKEILEIVSVGIDQTQWCQLVNQWSKLEDQERAIKHSTNVKKKTCPHTMGHVSSVRKKKEMV
ncbi:hypothetical protein IEQ34_011856 [Dendrobium chrysotoxum]|uniref:Uncharacterized protein n=1 Tax=Dendrobium chrysotoxum TaxID=161865 RepID=A0AAV7GRP9_DENCH|nr:hypothetical protein IEQ34_011856 [Dendrobium chrysotoxum]